MTYKEQLYSHLHSKNLLTDELKGAIEGFTYKREPITSLLFGKYRGKTLDEIKQFDQKYLEWLIKQSFCREDLKEAINKVLEKTI